MVPLPSQSPPPFIPRGRQITFSPEAPFSRATKPHPLLHGAPTAPISQPPSYLMPETLSICRHAMGCVPLTPCCWSFLDDGRVNHTGADSPPPLFTVPEQIQLWTRTEPPCCFLVAIDHRDISTSMPPVATATALASPTRQLERPTSPGRQIGHNLISNHFI